MTGRQTLPSVIAVFLLAQGLLQANVPMGQLSKRELAALQYQRITLQTSNERYPARRIPWNGPSEIKNMNMRLLATLYGDVHNDDGVPVADDVIQGFDLSPDGNTLVCTYYPDMLIIWDAQTGARRKRIILPKPGFGDIAFSPDGAIFVTAHGNLPQEQEARSIRFWDAKTYQVIARINSTGYVHSVKFSPNGKILAVVSDMNTGSDNSKTIVQLWNVQLKRLAAVQPAKGRPINEVAFSPDGSKLATSTKQVVEVWDIRTGELIHTLQGHQGEVSSVMFSPDSRFLVSAGGQFSVDRRSGGELIIWNVVTGQKVKILQGYKYASFSPDGRLITSSSQEEDYSVIDMNTVMVVSNFPQIGILRFSRNGSRAASYLFEETVVIRTWQLLK